MRRIAAPSRENRSRNAVISRLISLNPFHGFLAAATATPVATCQFVGRRGVAAGRRPLVPGHDEL